jgi:xanthine dehydrogenase small subunit
VVLASLEDDRIVHRPVNACILLLGQIDGCELLTIEDLASTEGALHPVQAEMVAQHGSQCGFCTPGIVMSLFAAWHDAPRPFSHEAACEWLAGNLCRCTGYGSILDAAEIAFAKPPEDAFARALPARIAALRALQDDADLFCGNEARFFAAPASLDSAADLALRHPDALIVAGATDVGLWITKRLEDHPRILWLGRIPALKQITSDAKELCLGAGVTHAAAMPHLAAIDPVLGEVMRRFGARQVRASGTLGGNIANGSPIGDLAPLLIALGASITLRRGGLRRSMPLEAFFIAYGRQNRDAGEILTEFCIPRPKEGAAFRAFKISKRFDEDISTLLAAFAFTLQGGIVRDARLAFGGMAGIPKRASQTEAALIGCALHDAAGFAAAAKRLSLDFAPITDMRASAAYRLRVAENLILKARYELAGDCVETRIRPRKAAVAIPEPPHFAQSPP